MPVSLLNRGGGRNLRVLWLLGITAVISIGTGQYLFPQAGKFCQADTAHSTEQLILSQPKGQYLIPSDMMIEAGHLRWRALPGAVWENYPNAPLPYYSIRPGSSGSATCRVKDKDGRWWLVDVAGRGRNGGSRYIPASSVTWEPGL